VLVYATGTTRSSSCLWWSAISRTKEPSSSAGSCTWLPSARCLHCCDEQIRTRGLVDTDLPSSYGSTLSSSSLRPSCCSRRPPTAHTILATPPTHLGQALQVGAAVLHCARDAAQPGDTPSATWRYGMSSPWGLGTRWEPPDLPRTKPLSWWSTGSWPWLPSARFSHCYDEQIGMRVVAIADLPSSSMASSYVLIALARLVDLIWDRPVQELENNSDMICYA
jgi:hypothetical protein